jgi:hypothetical protein
MALTKPAAVGFWVIGGFLVALGIIVWSVAITFSPGSLVMIAIGIFMFWAGGTPPPTN